MNQVILKTNTSQPEYRVDLEVFSGPLDLLLYLIKKEEVDIYDIPITRITRQYLQYMEMMQTLNLDVAGEFILMAATLIRVKASLLLPRDETETDETDPREELILALIEYKKYKEAGDMLRDYALLEERRYVPPSPVSNIKGRLDLVPSSSLWDLISAFREVMQARREESVHRINHEEVKIEDRIKVVLLLLREKGFATFSELFADSPNRLVAVVTFIAILELARTRRVRLNQAEPFSELRVYRGDAFDTPMRDIDLEEYSTVVEQYDGN